MSYTTILVETKADITTITFNRTKHRNSMSEQFLLELNAALDAEEEKPEIKTVILQGKEGFFCTGMDFEEASKKTPNENSTPDNNYMKILKKLSSLSKITIAKVDGRVLAGGMGIMSACDLVIASSKSQFGLSEAMWGLLPANVMPYLIRRVGFQSAYLLTLTMQNINATKANEIKLIDEISDDLDDCLRRYMIFFRRIDTTTIKEAKAFFRKMWIVDDEMEKTATNELNKLISQENVINNIKNFILHGKLPFSKG